LGWCHKRIGRIDQAIEDLQKAEEVAPDEAVVPYNLACYWSLVGNKDQALNHLSRAIAMDPNFRDLINNEPDFDPLRSDPEFRALTEIIV
jgi:tetratricopeptide (TPR) repeat protein